MGQGPPTLKELGKGKFAHEAALPDQPEPIDPYKVASAGLQAQVDLAPSVYASEAKYRPQYADLDNDILRRTLLGNSSFDANKALADMDEAGRSQVAAEAAKSGRSPAQWLTDHTNEQSAAGDANAQASLKKYTSASGGLMDLYGAIAPGLSQQEAAANSRQRTADVADVTALGPKARAAYLAANPELAGAMSGLDQRIAAARNVTPNKLSNTYSAPTDALTATGARRSSLSPLLLGDAARYADKSALQQQLEGQASAELGRNGALSDEDMRTAQQTARAASSARGIYDSNSAMSAEVLNTSAMQRQRLNEARQFAANTDASGMAQLNAGRSFALGVEGSENSRNQFNAGQTNAAAAQNFAQNNQNAQFGASMEAGRELNQAQLDRTAVNDQFAREFQLAGMYQSQATDPFQMVLGRSGVPAATQGAVNQGAYSQQAGPQLFNPFNSDILNIYAGNNANASAAATSAANNAAAVSAGNMQAGGTAAAALIAL